MDLEGVKNGEGGREKSGSMHFSPKKTEPVFKERVNPSVPVIATPGPSRVDFFGP